MNKQKADEIITEYFPKIYGFAIKKSFSYEEAEDLCADIVKEVYISLLKSEEIFNLEGYVWRISEHVFSKYVSSKKRHEGVSIDGMEIPYHDEYFSEEIEEEILLLRREIAFLTKKRREIVYSFYYENKTIASISNEQNMPEGTVKWHLSKARNELKEGFLMERRIGKLGMAPVEAIGFGHSGDPGKSGGTEYYLSDKINLNIVYSVYFEPKTKVEIAEELGMTPVFIEDKIAFLEENGFLVRQSGDKFTTYVKFSPMTYSLEQKENVLKKKLEVAKLLAKEYVPLVREAVRNESDRLYIPSGNYELFEAALVYYALVEKCRINVSRDCSKYEIKTVDGGYFTAEVFFDAKQSDTDYKPTLELPSYYSCGSMWRIPEKYPAVSSWSIDTRYCSRQGAWQNNKTKDYEYLYEFLKGEIKDNQASEDKFKRLRERRFITEDNHVNIMMYKGVAEDLFDKLPSLSEEFKKKFADYALESAMLEAKNYPPQMQDLIVSWNTNGFVGNVVALMVMDILYGDGTFKGLTEEEKVTSQLIMFSDILPE